MSKLRQGTFVKTKDGEGWIVGRSNTNDRVFLVKLYKHITFGHNGNNSLLVNDRTNEKFTNKSEQNCFYYNRTDIESVNMKGRYVKSKVDNVYSIPSKKGDVFEYVSDEKIKHLMGDKEWSWFLNGELFDLLPETHTAFLQRNNIPEKLQPGFYKLKTEIKHASGIVIPKNNIVRLISYEDTFYCNIRYDSLFQTLHAVVHEDFLEFIHPYQLGPPINEEKILDEKPFITSDLKKKEKSKVILPTIPYLHLQFKPKKKK